MGLRQGVRSAAHQYWSQSLVTGDTRSPSPEVSGAKRPWSCDYTTSPASRAQFYSIIFKVDTILKTKDPAIETKNT